MKLNEFIKILLGVLVLLIITYCFLVMNKKDCVKHNKRVDPPRSVPRSLEAQYACNQFTSCNTTGFMNFKHY